MSSLRIIFAALLAVWLAPAGVSAQAVLSPLARVTGADGVQLVDRSGGTEIVMTLSQPVPWRVFTLDEPRRLVLDFGEIAWSGTPIGNQSARVAAARTGPVQPGWSRLVADLAEPMAITRAALETGRADGSARLVVRLDPVDAGHFAARSGAPDSARFRLERRQLTPRVPTKPTRPDRLTIVLDPGHGGIDPGAEAGGLQEAALMLTFARELKETLLRSGRFDVALTRDRDVFVPLETRITLARSAGADLFISLHADALAEGTGSASGATVYTLSEDASDAASLALAERHNRDDLLAGLDLSDQSDEIALVLMDLARSETAVRSDGLAEALVEGFRGRGVKINTRPRRSAAFAVLKSPDIPSVLVEIGFLSSARDRARLADAAWRAETARAITDALRSWSVSDAAQARLLRQ